MERNTPGNFPGPVIGMDRNDPDVVPDSHRNDGTSRTDSDF